MAKSTTKPSAPYTEADLAALGHHLLQVYYTTGSAPDSIRAQVEYHGTMTRNSGGVRTFTLDQLSQAQRRTTEDAAARADAAQILAGQAQPLVSYDRKGWRARFRQLAATARGRAALERAGASTNRGTRTAWLLGGRANRANQNAINRAYQDIRMGPVRAAEEAAEEAILELAETFDDAVSQAYGSNGVRFRDIEG